MRHMLCLTLDLHSTNDQHLEEHLMLFQKLHERAQGFSRYNKVSRDNILEVTLASHKIPNSHVLDKVSKTPVCSIHYMDIHLHFSDFLLAYLGFILNFSCYTIQMSAKITNRARAVIEPAVFRHRAMTNITFENQALLCSRIGIYECKRVFMIFTVHSLRTFRSPNMEIKLANRAVV